MDGGRRSYYQGVESDRNGYGMLWMTVYRSGILPEGLKEQGCLLRYVYSSNVEKSPDSNWRVCEDMLCITLYKP